MKKIYANTIFILILLQCVIIKIKFLEKKNYINKKKRKKKMERKFFIEFSLAIFQLEKSVKQNLFILTLFYIRGGSSVRGLSEGSFL